MRSVFAILCLLWTNLPSEAGVAADSAYFEKHIRPLLVNHCYECHSIERGKSKGGLLLDSRLGWERGGDRGPAIHPGSPEQSLLLRAVSYRDSELQMPPKKRLGELDRQHLKNWIENGAFDPRESAVALPVRKKEQADVPLWSMEPIQSPKPPDISSSDWSRGPTDRFLEEKHGLAKLAPAPDADPNTLLRRLYVTLTGLPPTPDQIDSFLADGSPNRLGRLTDRLLASPRYGEQWGRHWLDVTRFAESSGGGRSLMFKEAWRFRDYVIRAFNEDVPFNTLIHEHLAGDLLFQQEPTEAPRQAERLTATGFLALGPTNYELQDKELLRMEVVDEQIDTMGRAFLGMTLGCARCHDHKFDPVSTNEYYALAGIFRSTKTITPGNVSGFVQTPLPGPGYDKRLAYERELERRRSELELAEKQDKARAKGLKKALEAFEKSAPPALAKVMSVRDEVGSEVADCHVRLRGAIRSLGEQVPRGFLVAATPPGETAQPKLGRDSSGRLALADWLTHPRHTLTARVYVNRLWHHVFGRGLVRTVDNFGHTGEEPSHPELLDYLASDFIHHGQWSSKRLVRTLVVSRAFQLGRGLATASIDPENRLLWRAHDRALSAESLRDAMLQVSGELDLSVGGLTIEKFSAYDNGYQFGEFKRRAVYAPAFRNARLEMLNLFDAANPNISEGKRTRTTLATQALFLMNSPFVMERSTVFARRLQAAPASDEARLDMAYQHILGRLPSSQERQVAQAYLLEFTSEIAWATLAQSLFASVDFRNLR